MAHQKYKNNKGDVVPSVTTIIGGNLGWNKEALMYWANNMGLEGKKHRDVSKEACETGTLVHAYLESHIKHEPIDEELKTKASMDQIIIAERALEYWKEWEKNTGIEYIKSEIQMVSEAFGFGGTADLIAKINDKICLLDFKTSKGITSDHIIQMAAYDAALREHDYFFEEYYLIHIDKKFEDTTKNIITPVKISKEMITDGWNVFWNLLQIHSRKKQFNQYEKEFKCSH